MRARITLHARHLSPHSCLCIPSGFRTGSTIEWISHSSDSSNIYSDYLRIADQRETATTVSRACAREQRIDTPSRCGDRVSDCSGLDG